MEMAMMVSDAGTVDCTSTYPTMDPQSASLRVCLLLSGIIIVDHGQLVVKELQAERRSGKSCYSTMDEDGRR